MKTTLDLPDDLMRAAKIRAAEHNQRLKDLVADTLRTALSAPRDEARIAPATGRGAPSAPSRERFAALLEQLDRVPERPDAADPLAWDTLGLPR